MITEEIRDRPYRGENLIFIVGCQRSGTTWLQKLIACHPRIKTGAESNVFSSFIGPELRMWNEQLQRIREGKARTGLPSYFSEEEFMPIISEHMMKLLSPMLSQLKEDQIFLEKSPDHAFFLPEIAQMLPESKIIHILRDGRDVVASLLNASQSWAQHWAPSDSRKAARMWVKHVKAVRDGSRKLTKDQFLEVRYEDLLMSTPQVLRRTTGFLNLAWSDEDMMKAIEQNSAEVARRTGGTEIAVGGETARVPDDIRKQPPKIRKARAGSWKEDLSFTDKFRVWRVTRRTMDEVGYHWAYPW